MQSAVEQVETSARGHTLRDTGLLRGAEDQQENTPEQQAAKENRRVAPMAKASLRRIRDASLSAAFGDLEHCLQAGDAVALAISVAANGEIKKVSLDDPSFLSLTEDCLVRGLDRIRFEPGLFSTKHRRRLERSRHEGG